MPRKRIYKTGKPNRADYRRVPRFLPDPKTGDIVPMSPMRRAIVRALVSSDSIAEAAKSAGTTPTTACNALKIPAVQQYLKEQLEAAGVTHGLIMERIRQGLDATKGKDKYNKERPDFAERRATAQLALRLQGLSERPDEEAGSGPTAQNIYNIVIQARQARELEPRDVTPQNEPEKDKT